MTLRHLTYAMILYESTTSPQLLAPHTSHLTSLTSEAVQLNGTIPAWGANGTMPKLARLVINQNPLHGPVPVDLARCWLACLTRNLSECSHHSRSQEQYEHCIRHAACQLLHSKDHPAVQARPSTQLQRQAAVHTADRFILQFYTATKPRPPCFLDKRSVLAACPLPSFAVDTNTGLCNTNSSLSQPAGSLIANFTQAWTASLPSCTPIHRMLMIDARSQSTGSSCYPELLLH